MEIRKNAGYTITDSIRIGNAEFVIGYHPTAPAPYVTWECANGNHYFWGHYLSDRQAAERDLLERAGRELDLQTEHKAHMPKTKARER